MPKYNSLAEVQCNVYLILICSELARISCGWHLKLDQFASIVDFLTAICYREQSLEQLQAFEEEVKGRSKGKYIILQFCIPSFLPSFLPFFFPKPLSFYCVVASFHPFFPHPFLPSFLPSLDPHTNICSFLPTFLSNLPIIFYLFFSYVIILKNYIFVNFIATKLLRYLLCI